MQRFSVCRSLGQSRFVHVRLVSLEIAVCLIAVALACCILLMLFVRRWTINIITCFCGWRCIGGSVRLGYNRTGLFYGYFKILVSLGWML